MKQEYKFVYNALLRACDSMLHLLQKGADFAKEKNNAGKTESEIMETRIYPDMFPYIRQVQIFADNVAGGVARVYGMEKPSMPDTEKTFVELIEKVNKVKDFVKSIDPEKVDGIENRKIVLPWMKDGGYFEAGDYLQDYVLQNSLFHLITSYNILRHLGLSIGKTDYMGDLKFKK